MDHANDVRRKSLLLRFPKDKVRKKRRHGEEECDYLEKRKSIQRRKTNPEVNRYLFAVEVTVSWLHYMLC